MKKVCTSYYLHFNRHKSSVFSWKKLLFMIYEQTFLLLWGKDISSRGLFISEINWVAQLNVHISARITDMNENKRKQ